MKNLLEKLTPWIIFLIALITYSLTMEPTNSWWDCGEYIATAYKLQVGHPPGAPLFLLVANFFSQFALGDVEKVAMMINLMSVLCSAFTILFLFWTIHILSKKIVPNQSKYITTLSAAVGSLIYTFSDSFWFSAVEGEVYAMSSLFTAVVFWAIIKWGNEQGKTPKADKWLVFIAYLIGLSIGVHMLSLLVIPAIVLIYYFKKYTFSIKGFIIANIISVIFLGLIYNIIIPQFVNIAGKLEIFFVNELSLPFNTGTIFFFLLTICIIVLLLIFTKKNNYYYANTAVLSCTFLLIGYMSFFTLIIRSNANTPIDENSPEDAVSLLSYLNREQYGYSPLLYGQYFNTQVEQYDDGKPVFVPKYIIYEIRNDGKKNTRTKKGVFYKHDLKDFKNDTIFSNSLAQEFISYEFKDHYAISDDRKSSVPIYNDNQSGFFPRMWSRDQRHIEAYKEWGKINNTNKKPDFIQNLRFFFNYQINHMYIRYFMWNFAGKQNDKQGHGELNNGNWISGINLIDNIRLGPQKNLPAHIEENAGRNKYYFFPLILGFIGLLFHYQNSPKDTWVVFLLFFFTGLAIVIELNQTPFQPRERDYAYVGSFYAFSIWAGIGVLGIKNILEHLILRNKKIVLTICTSTLIIPFLMADQGWDDHDRSNRFTAREFAKNYLKSCEPNAILFTMGDNDTFPLWYVQEVEGYRTDVRIVNLSLLNTDWYIDQMKRDAYDGQAVPFSLKKDKYKQGTRDVAIYIDKGASSQKTLELRDFNKWIQSDRKETKIDFGKEYDFYYTKKIRIPVNKENTKNYQFQNDSVLDYLDIELKTSQLEKKDLMILDLIETNDWERPIYFAITIGSSGRQFLYLEKHFRLDGMVYKLMPIDYSQSSGEIGGINTDILYSILMPDELCAKQLRVPQDSTKCCNYNWGNLNTDIYLDETNIRMTMNFRNNFSRLAQELIKENKYKKAEQVLDYCMLTMPAKKVPLNYFIHPIIESYYTVNSSEKGSKLASDLAKKYTAELDYYFSFPKAKIPGVQMEILKNLQFFNQLVEISLKNNHAESNIMQQNFEKFYRQFLIL